jgi:hypothetical protein
MMLATTKVEDFDQFLKIFSTKGAEKRKQHGSKGAAVFRDPVELDRVWVVFDWDEQGFKNFVSDPGPPSSRKRGTSECRSRHSWAVASTRNWSRVDRKRYRLRAREHAPRYGP